MAKLKRNDVGGVWSRFVQALKAVLDIPPRHRHQEHFVPASDAALAYAGSDRVSLEMQAAYDAVGEIDPEFHGMEPADIAVMELEAFPRAARTWRRDRAQRTTRRGARTNLLAMAKTVLGSVADLFSLTPAGKAALTVLKEAIEFAEAEKKPEDEEPRDPELRDPEPPWKGPFRS